MANYRISAKADDDLDRLFVHGVLNFGLDRTEQYTAGLVEHFSALAAEPLLYQAVDHIRKGYRRSVFRAHAIYYRLDGDDVLIARVLGRQDAGEAL